MKNQKILIVDDESNIRDILKDRLEATGYQVIQASDGKEGLALTESEEPDLILLDLKMPKMDGIEVLERLRKKFPEIIVIVLTGHGTIGLAVEAMKLGAFDFITKPCNNFMPNTRSVSKVLPKLNRNIAYYVFFLFFRHIFPVFRRDKLNKIK